MANDVNNVVVGKPLSTGGILVAPVGTALPSDESSVLDVAYKPVGYLSSDGATKSENRTSTVIHAWGGDTIAALQTAFGVQWKFKMAEFLNAVVQRALYGDANVLTTPATSTSGNKMHIIGKSTPCPRLTWIIEVVYEEKHIRIVIPDAQITTVGDQTYKDDDIAAADVTLESFPGVDGAYFHTYTNDGHTTV